MKRIPLLFPLLVACSVALASPALAATSGTSNVTLAANATAQIVILDPTLTLTPTAADYNNDYVEAVGASGLRVQCKSNSSTGMQLLVRCADAAPQIALADLLVKTQTAPGTGGTTMAAYNPVTAVNQLLWSSGTTQGPWVVVTTDVRVQNLFAYPDAAGGGATNYTNTLTYSVVVQ